MNPFCGKFAIAAAPRGWQDPLGAGMPYPDEHGFLAESPNPAIPRGIRKQVQVRTVREGAEQGMSIPAAQMAAVAKYVLEQRLAGREKYPLVLMLEPLFRCNLSCTGCGKIQYPVSILKKDLSVEDCLRASEECE